MSKTFFEDADLKVHVTAPSGYPFVHLELNRWSPSVAKKLFGVRAQLVAAAKRTGVKALFATNPNQDSTWFKFMDVLQFQKLTEHEGRSIYFLETK